jgi:hypothetical protein
MPGGMKSRFKTKLFNGLFMLVVYIIAGLLSCAHSQSQQRVCEKGAEISFGMHNLSRNGKPGLRAPVPGSRGISLGYYFGNNLLKTRLRGVGYYESTDIAEKPLHIFEGDALISLYPLEFIRTRSNMLDLYITVGVNFTHLSIDKYTSGVSASPINRIGQVAGIGVEYVVRKQAKILRAFFELNCNQGFIKPTAPESETNMLPKLSAGVNVGIRVAYKRHVKVRPSTW